MNNIEQDHGNHHECGIAGVKINLATQKIPILALDIFNNPENAPNENQKTGDIKNVDVPLPGQFVDIDRRQCSRILRGVCRRVWTIGFPLGEPTKTSPESEWAGPAKRNMFLDWFVIDETIVEYASDYDEKAEERELGEET